ncbi:AfsR/SARP family transcriptional regulator [Glycomyces buryatensis]|uniref:OmpR/PhoB-type domain-containing protein n=1 Tax=Glycomyces buryatensis TaxID=2570927 RepID=A0A4V6T6M8_9ACTN|nr:BTAD domain-containing putative transcriptional regulator [Glycomyces buryatensis]THV38706.1 hypothetical protein FAB82_19970 [Glycomyces buryatensis]
MADELEFNVLGPLEIRLGGRSMLRLPPIRRRLLAILLARAGREVTVDELTEALWSGTPPPSATATLQVHIHRLREKLGGAERIVRGPAGYRIAVTTAEFDVLRFDELYDRARTERNTGQSESAVDTLEQALAMWRGEPYTGIEPSIHIATEVDRLGERRLIAEQALAEAWLDIGLHHQAIGALDALAQAYPYVERVRVLLILAFFRAARQVEALDVYREHRRFLTDRLGIEPGELMQRVHRAVLRGDERLHTLATSDLEGPWDVAPAPSVSAGVAAGAVPRELPPPPHGFTGRERELRLLDDLLPGADSSHPAPVPIVVVAGMGGVGKTALSVHWGHRVADRFPDGQVFIDLRGHGGAAAIDPADALTALLDSLGVPDQDIPAEPERAAARFRTETGGKRVLIVLDNAAAADQVRPLLPGGSGCMVLVTSRHRLSDLVVGHGGTRVRLDPLMSDEAQSLLRQLLPRRPIPNDGNGIAALADLCGRLPLALRIAAADLADNPNDDLGSYVARLSGDDLLASLQVDGADDAALRAVFDSSYRTLPPEARRLFRLLGLVPGQDFTVEAVAALAGGAVESVEPVLDQLVAAHLVDQHRPGRYRLHDLLRHYAQERAEADEARQSRDDAAGRLTAWYLHRTDVCRNLLYLPFTALTPPDYMDESFEPSTIEAVEWLTAERGNLTAAIEHAAAHGPNPAAWLLNDALGGFMWLGTHSTEALKLGRTVLAAAERAGDLPGRSATELSLAWTLLRSNRSAEAIEHGERAAHLAVEAEWLPGQAAAGHHLAYACASIGRLPQARDHAVSALRANRELESPTQISNLEALGGIHLHLGDLKASAEYFLEQIRATEASGRPADSPTRVNLAGAYLYLGRLNLARDQVRELLDPGSATGFSNPFAGQYRVAAHLELAAGRPEEAMANAQLEVDGLGDNPDPRREAAATVTMAAARDALGEHSEAIVLFDRALKLTEGGSFYHRVESMVGRARALLRVGELDRALEAADETLAAARDWGYGVFEGQALNLIAEVELGLRRTDAAAAHAEAALRVNLGTGHRPGEAESHRLLGEVREAEGDRVDPPGNAKSSGC